MAWQAKSAVLLIALWCGLSSPSHAVNLNNDGTGQVLIYPYYTVQNGNQTLISVLNFSTTGKAVKLRILEGRNAREVLSLNLYLAPEDVWTGAIFDTDEQGPGRIVSTDRSCTVPQLEQSGESINGVYYATFSNANFITPSADGGPSALERTREGFIEAIEMASIMPGSELDLLISHAEGIAADCGQLNRQWALHSDGNEPFASSLAAPSGGLSGSAAIVDSSNGVYINVDPQILDGFYQTTTHTRPGSMLPSLRSAQPQAVVLSVGEAIRSSWNGRAEDAVSAVFMSEQLRNEYNNETALNAASEWIVTFPTKRFYTDAYVAGPNVPFPPFSEVFAGGGACELYEYEAYDREEGKPQTVSGFPTMPPPPPPPSFCFGVNVLTVRQSIQVASDLSSSPSRVFASKLSRNVNPILPVRSGWMTVKLSQVTTGSGSAVRQLRPSMQGHTYIGLPAIGFAAIRIENHNAAPGVRGYYGGAYNHKRKIRCLGAEDNGAQNTACAN